MRTKYSIINISFGLLSQFIITLLSFISRTVFINSLGIEYLGINGLLTNILALLSLAEAGIGSSIIYSLYKPVAEQDQRKIQILMKFYRNAYLVIAAITFLTGLLLLPFLGYIAKDTQVDNIPVIYLIFLVNAVLPYLYVHKNTFLQVNQKGYIVTSVYTVSSITALFLKIGVLHYTHNFIYYLIIETIITLATSVSLAYTANRLYPYLKKKTSGKLSGEARNKITKNVKAIILQNTGNFLVLGTDNLIISTFISIAAVGIYSNYNMLIEIFRTFINQVFSNVYHSIGNLVAENNADRIYFIFKVCRFISFWLYSLASILLIVLLEPFIKVWLGSEFLMEPVTLAVLVILFFERGMRNSISAVKTTAGIFQSDRYVPLVQAIINLAVSIILVQYIGILGVFLGTLISTILGPYWTTPYLVYKKVFDLSVIQYFIDYAKYLAIGLSNLFVTYTLCGLISVEGLYGLGIKTILCCIIPNVIMLVIFRKTDEFTFVSGIILKIFKTIRVKTKIKLNIS